LFDGLSGPQADLEVTGLTADSRKVRPGVVFAALKGVATDGRRFVGQAVEAGAVAILCEGLEPGTPDPGVPVIKSPEPRATLAVAASRFWPGQPAHCVGVTGTNGKSSTVDFLRQIWSHAGLRAASMGTLGAIGPEGTIDLGHTTPDPVAIHSTLHALHAQGVTHLAMETSSHGLDQHRLVGVRLSAGAFTNLTQDHLDYHVSMDAYRDAKLKLFRERLAPGAVAVINADSPEHPAFFEAARTRGLVPVLVGWRGGDLKIRELMPRAHGQRMFLTWRGQEFEADLPLIGEFQALNALCAAGLALAGGLGVTDVAAGLRALKPVKGRLEFVGASASGAGVFVDYAHTPDGLDVLIRAARPHTAGRLIVVFGCGGDRDRTKRPLMGAIAARQADQVIVTDDNPRTEEPASIRAAILAACPGATEIGDRRTAILEGVARLRAGDTLLIAGKGHETGQIVGTQTLPFSDQDTARDALGGLAR
jgi:UDP-N-acetylmuramoyl-L-alanyl-D-glutamate--2,6-diaminopimelate ligase